MVPFNWWSSVRSASIGRRAPQLLLRNAAQDMAVLNKLIDDREISDEILGYHAQQNPYPRSHNIGRTDTTSAVTLFLLFKSKPSCLSSIGGVYNRCSRSALPENEVIHTCHCRTQGLIPQGFLKIQYEQQKKYQSMYFGQAAEISNKVYQIALTIKGTSKKELFSSFSCS